MAAIGSFCRTGSGTTPPRSAADRYYGGAIPWVKSGELRRKRRDALSKLNELPSHLLADVCGDPAGNPTGWPISRLGDICNSLSDGPHMSPEYVQSGIPFLSTRNIRTEGIVWDDLKF